jgi:Cu-Zn family superoxide dismutase
LRGEGQRVPLLEGNGSALVLHENPDDYTTQPIGGAGARIGCAVLK